MGFSFVGQRARSPGSGVVPRVGTRLCLRSRLRTFHPCSREAVVRLIQAGCVATIFIGWVMASTSSAEARHTRAVRVGRGRDLLLYRRRLGHVVDLLDGLVLDLDGLVHGLATHVGGLVLDGVHPRFFGSFEARSKFELVFA